ncbi:MAG: heme-copper oxidase subunit III [Terrimicrobiaceae bacterium]|nr:heme-copper oxidase subunit III [Terrimicrobiaceae bacterium]
MDTFINQPVSIDEITPWRPPSIRKVGMLTLITTESALFAIFVVAYIFYIGKSLNGPYPHELLEIPWSASFALFGSSATITFAEFALKKGNRPLFHLWWFITIAMGIYFLGFTAYEWHEFIFEKHLTISTNVFGTTFYSLVGLHASHVVVGLLLLGTILISSLRNKLDHEHHEHVEIISWYWHFVDAVWAVVLTVVYFISAHY